MQLQAVKGSRVGRWEGCRPERQLPDSSPCATRIYQHLLFHYAPLRWQNSSYPAPGWCHISENTVCLPQVYKPFFSPDLRTDNIYGTFRHSIPDSESACSRIKEAIFPMQLRQKIKMMRCAEQKKAKDQKAWNESWLQKRQKVSNTEGLDVKELGEAVNKSRIHVLRIIAVFFFSNQNKKHY